MSIVRIQRRDNPFAQIDKATLADDRLSFRATGLLAYLLAKPDDWRIDIRHLATVKLDGYKAVAAAMRELRAAGYVSRERVRDPDGRFSWESTVYETPGSGYPQSPGYPQGGLSTGHHSPEWTHGATSGNGALPQVGTTDPKPLIGKGVPVLRRETDIKARGRASQANPQSTPPPSTVPGYRHDANAGHAPDPDDCERCGTHRGRRRSTPTVRKAALAALGIAEDGDALPPPVDLEAERARQQTALTKLIDEAGAP